jgi:DNA-binding response OmpR family regulator
VVRRRGAATGSGRAKPSGWHLDQRRHEITWNGALVPATAIEFRLLAALVGRLDELVPHADLLAAGWPDVPDPDPLWLKPHLARLRDKLNNVGAPVPIAVRAVGYRLAA